MRLTRRRLLGSAAAVGARGPSGFNIDEATPVGDANYTVLATDRSVMTTTALTAARIWTLPPANSVNPGQQLVVFDRVGGVTGSNTITLQRSGSDTINGGTSVVINTAYGGEILISDGVSKWTALSTGGGGGGAVSSVFGRTGAVTAQSGDYSFPLISGTLNLGTQVTSTLPVLNGGTGATAAGATAANNIGALAISSNLSDLASATSARTNLGLGTAATQNTGTSGAVLPLLSTANTWTLGQTFNSAPTLGSITGAIQCLHVNSSGLVSGTGTDCGSGGGAVSSVFGRSGVVTAQSGDYSFSLISGNLALSQLAPQAADTIVINATGGSASPTAGSLVSCSASSSALTYNTSTHAFGCNTISGSGTVNPGTAGQLAGYAATGTAVSGVTLSGTLTYNTSTNTLSSTVPNSTKTANYTVAAADMGGTVNLGGTGATLTIPAISSTVLAQGMSVCYASQATGNWTISSAPTINGLNSTTVPPGGAACLVSNGTSLDLQPGAQLPTATSIGGVMSLTCGAGNFVNGIGTNGQPACGTPAGGGNVTAVGTLTSGQITIGQGAQSVAVDANASLSAGALSLGASGTAGSLVLGNATSGTVTVQSVTGALGTVIASLPANTGTLAETNLAQTWSATQTFGKIGGFLVNVTSQSGTTYTLASTDCGTFIRFTSGSAVTVTLPNSLSVGCQVAMEQASTGQITLSPAAGAALSSAHSFTKTFGMNAVVGVTVDTNSGGTAATYVMTGDGA